MRPRKIGDIEIPERLHCFLQQLSFEQENVTPGDWAFTVYTTFPVFSFSNSTNEKPTDEEFNFWVCERFQSYIESYLRLKVEKPYGVKIPLDIEYIRLPSASIADARKHFRAKNGWPEPYRPLLRTEHSSFDYRKTYFLIIDEETTDALFEAPDALKKLRKSSSYEDQTKGEDTVVVYFVDADYDEESGGEIFSTSCRRPTKGSSNCTTFYGYMKTTPRWLKNLFTEVFEEGFHLVFRHKDLVYRGSHYGI